jgi:hypothetical protein
MYREGAGFYYNGVAVGVGFDFGLSWNCFAFVPIGHFCDPHPRRYCVGPGQVTQIYNHTTIINNYNVHDHHFVNHGIDPERISGVTRKPIHPVSIRDTDSPVGHGQRGDQLSHDGGTLVVHHPNFVDHPVPGENRNNHPLPPGSPAQNHFPPPNGNQPAQPTRQMGQPPQGPNAIPHGSPDHNASPPNGNQPVPPTRQMGQPPQVPNNTPTTPHGSQNRNEFSVPNQPQRPSPPAPSAPDSNNRNLSPRAGEQAHPPQSIRPNPYTPGAPVVIPAGGQGKSGATGAGHENAPVVAPAQPQPQHSQPVSSPPPASSPRSSGQNQNQNSSGNSSGNGSGHGSGH